MTDTSSRLLVDRIAVRFGRRGFAKSAALVGVGALLSRVDSLRAWAQTSPDIAAIINDLITIEAFSTTFYGVARANQVDGAYTDEVKRLARTAQCQEEAHYNFLRLGNALPSTSTFTIATKIVASQESFLTKSAEIESISLAALLAASRAFAEIGAIDLSEIGFEMGATEAQHLVLSRAYLDLRPPNDRAFAEWRFANPSEAVEALGNAGFIAGNGRSYDYPGPIEINCRSVIGLVPVTTTERLETSQLDKQSGEIGPASATPETEA